MKILLTGHNGFIGRKLHAALHEDVTGLDCDYDYDQFHIPPGRFDLVIHCGGLAVDSGNVNKLWNLNYKATTEIGDYCFETDTKLVFVSSAAAIDPKNSYGWSKHCAEYFLKTSVKELCILRPFNVWSYHEIPPRSIVSKLLNRQLPQVFRNCSRDFVHINDIINAVMQLVGNWHEGTYELGTGESTDIETLANYLYADTDESFLVTDCPQVNTFSPHIFARQVNLLPNWTPTPLSKNLLKLKEVFD